MNWGSWADFWAMGGYGVYVWGSYFVAGVVLVTEVVLVRQRRGNVLDHLRRRARAEASASPASRGGEAGTP